MLVAGVVVVVAVVVVVIGVEGRRAGVVRRGGQVLRQALRVEDAAGVRRVAVFEL